MLVIVAEIIVQDEILDALLLFALSFLLALHRHCKVRIGRKLDSFSLKRGQYAGADDMQKR